MRGNDTREDIPVQDREELFEIEDQARPGVGEGEGGKSRIGIGREICFYRGSSLVNLREKLIKGSTG